jgi:hypothetical protein
MAKTSRLGNAPFMRDGAAALSALRREAKRSFMWARHRYWTAGHRTPVATRFEVTVGAAANIGFSMTRSSTAAVKPPASSQKEKSARRSCLGGGVRSLNLVGIGANSNRTATKGNVWSATSNRCWRRRCPRSANDGAYFNYSHCVAARTKGDRLPPISSRFLWHSHKTPRAPGLRSGMSKLSRCYLARPTARSGFSKRTLEPEKEAFCSAWRRRGLHRFPKTQQKLLTTGRCANGIIFRMLTVAGGREPVSRPPPLQNIRAYRKQKFLYKIRAVKGGRGGKAAFRELSWPNSYRLGLRRFS